MEKKNILQEIFLSKKVHRSAQVFCHLFNTEKYQRKKRIHHQTGLDAMNISNACLRLATYIRRTTRRRISSTAMEYTQIAKMQNRLLDLQTENHICILCSILFPTLLLYIGDGIYWRQLLLT